MIFKMMPIWHHYYVGTYIYKYRKYHENLHPTNGIMHSYLYKYLGMLHTDTILLYKQGGLAKMQITHITILHICADIYVQSI